jgi:hypothetical protein
MRFVVRGAGLSNGLVRGLSMTVVLAACVLAAGCGGGSVPARAGLPEGTPDIFQATPPPGATGPGVTAQATLAHIPVGTVRLSWSSSNNVVNATINMTGLSQTGQFLGAVYSGPCDNRGNVAFALPGQIIPDQNGRAYLTVNVPNQPNGFPLNGSVSIQTQGAPGTPLNVSCGNLGSGSTGGTPTVGVGQSRANATANMGPTSDNNQNVTGRAYLREFSNNQLFVHIDVTGLQPNTSHNENINLGNCTYLSYVLYGLPTLNADGNGFASTDMTINNAQPIPPSGWYVGIKFGTDPGQAFNQTVACGNVQLLLGGG